ncbi:MAG: DUF2079 domain-containing protein [Ktedonobacterales bacterium]
MSSQSEVEPGLARRRPTRATPPSPSPSRGAVAATSLSDVRASIGHLWASLRTPRGKKLLAWTLVIAAIVLDCLLVGKHALVRYQSYRADAFDLGNMDQAVWNTLHGYPFRFTNRGLDTVGPPTRLAIHVEPILFLIAPLYLLHAGPETLIVLQTVALALGALPLFLLGLRRLSALPLVAAVIAAAYLVTPELLGEALWDFHPVALATPLLLLALWALDARRWPIFFVAAALAALTKEDVALSLLPLGLYIALWLGKRRLGVRLLVASLVWLALCFFVILPHYNIGVAGGNNYWYRYAWLGATPHEAVINLLTHPWLPITYVFGDTARSGYIALLLRTGGGLSIFAPALWICALPELAVNVLSVHWEQYSGFYQYNAMLVAYLMAASVYGVAALYNARLHAEHGAHTLSCVRESDSRSPGWGLHRLLLMGRRIAAAYHRALERIPVPSRWIASLVVIWLLVSGFWNIMSAGPRLSDFWRAGSAPIPHQAQIDALLARVPTAASVAATDTLNPHLSDRYTLYLMPDPQSYQAEYVAVNLADVPSFSKEADQRMYDTMLASGRYVVVGRVESVVVLHRAGPPLTPPGG